MNLNQTNSQNLLEQARTLLVGGVNSPVRAFRGFDFPPPFIERGQGVFLFDVDQNRYLDYVLSWGPLILGHADADVAQAVSHQLQKGFTYGAPTEIENLLALEIQHFYPCLEKMRMVSSGTEATMSAVRLARGYTGRKKLIKFNGCYHGHVDSLMVQAGSGLLTHAQPDSAGIPQELANLTLVAEFNRLEEVEAIFQANPKDIAALIVEPVPGNMGVILPEPGFLEGLRSLCTRYGALLILDEVMSGFRVAKGGAVARFGVVPDLLCLGKVVGGGLPLAVYGGKKEIMHSVSPLGPVYQGGTLSGNPLAVTCGLATLKKLNHLNPYQMFENYLQSLSEGLHKIFRARGRNFTINSCGSMFTLFFTEKPVRFKQDVDTFDRALFNKMFQALLEEGIYIAPSQYEAGFLSILHGPEELETTLKAFERAAQRVL